MNGVLSHKEIPFAFHGVLSSDKDFNYDLVTKTLTVEHISITNMVDLTTTGNTIIGDAWTDTLTVLAKLTGQLYCNDSGKSAQTLKIHNHLNTSSIWGAEFKTDTENTSWVYFWIYNEGILNKTGTASITTWIDRTVIASGATITGGTIIGHNWQVQVLGTVVWSWFVAWGYFLIETSTAMTASHVCSIWADSHMAEAVTWSHELIYGSNNWATSLDQVMYFSWQAEALLHLNTAGWPALNYVSATAETGWSSKKIKILIEWVVHYINAYTG